MKAAVWHGRRDIRVEEVPEPSSPPHGQVKVEIAACGICGTDLHEYLGGPVYIPWTTPHPLTGVKAPVILGHETVGRVVEVGSGVGRVKVGDRVALCPIIGCLECQWCKSGLMGLCPRSAYLGSSWHGGAFSRYVNVYDFMCYQLPREVSDDTTALVEPFAATVRAVGQANLRPGESIAIIGGGPIGLMALQAAKIAGAGRVIVFEPSPGRRQLAHECGAAVTIDPLTQDPLEAIREVTDGAGADVVIECVGLAATGVLAGRVARRKGRVVVMGVYEKPAPFDYTDLVFGEKTVMGSMGGYGVFDEAIKMIADGRFNGRPIVTARILLSDIVTAGFETLINNKDAHAKILVSPE
jgi:(R,R)-butanediol dehydrogenase/meso-butanediol dehydrogenase/diacetyl reductase